MDEMCLTASSFGSDWRDLTAYPLDGFPPTVRYGILLREHKHLSPQAAALIAKLRAELPHGPHNPSSSPAQRIPGSEQDLPPHTARRGYKPPRLTTLRRNERAGIPTADAPPEKVPARVWPL